MPNRNYIKGRRFEYEVRDLLRSEGFHLVRSAKSSFPDLLAIRVFLDKNDCTCHPKLPLKSEVRIIECKVGKYLSAQEKVEIREIAAKTGATPYVAYPIKQGRRKFIKMDVVQ